MSNVLSCACGLACTLTEDFIAMTNVAKWLFVTFSTLITIKLHWMNPLQWRHNWRDCVSNHQPHDCLLNRLFRRRSKKTSKLRDTGLCEWNSPVTGEFPAQKTSNAENVSILMTSSWVCKIVWDCTITCQLDVGFLWWNRECQCLIDQSHRYGRHQAACREPAGSYDKTTWTAICFEHKMQYLLIRAPYTRIVVFWHISSIPPWFRTVK